MTSAPRLPWRRAAAAVALLTAGAAGAAPPAAPLSAADVASAAQSASQSPSAPATPGTQAARRALQEMTGDDARIAAALAVTLARAPAIPDIGIDVNARVVTLSGRVADERQRERAGRLARGIQGVLEVENQIQVDQRLGVRLGVVLDELRERLLQLLARAPALLLALALVWAVHRVAGAVARRIGALRIRARNPYVQTLAARVVHVALVGVAVVVALDLLGATAVVGAVLGSAGVVGLALGFAFRDIAENYIAGAMLSLRRPFAPGDRLAINGHEGRVIALNARATVLMTADGNHLRLPNADVFKATIVNFSHNPLRRFTFQVDLDGAASAAQAERAGVDALRAVDGVLADPAPRMLAQSLGSAGLVVEYQGWVDQTRTDLPRARSAAIRAVKQALEDRGIWLARSTSYVVQTVDAAAPAAAVDRPQALDTGVDHALTAQFAQAQREVEESNLLGEGRRTE